MKKMDKVCGCLDTKSI